MWKLLRSSFALLKTVIMFTPEMKNAITSVLSISKNNKSNK